MEFSAEAWSNQQITRLMQFFIVTLVSVCAVIITIMTFVLNYAAPPRGPAVAPVAAPSVTINIPHQR